MIVEWELNCTFQHPTNSAHPLNELKHVIGPLKLSGDESIFDMFRNW